MGFSEKHLRRHIFFTYSVGQLHTVTFLKPESYVLYLGLFRVFRIDYVFHSMTVSYKMTKQAVEQGLNDKSYFWLY